MKSISYMAVTDKAMSRIKFLTGALIAEYIFGNGYNVQLRCCEPVQNANILHVWCAFSPARALSLNVVYIFRRLLVTS